MASKSDPAFFEFLLRQGDNTLVLGHRISEWCGTAPALEEDIALANSALDLIGQTQMWLALAGEVESKGRSADDLAYHRDVWDFRNLLLVERPNGDFGHTILRQYLFDAFQILNLKSLENSSDDRVADIATKSGKEASYHLERSRDTVIALGDGTTRSNEIMKEALVLLWPFAGEMFASDEVDEQMAASGIASDPSGFRDQWDHEVQSTFSEAMLPVPDTDFAHHGGKSGARHTEHLGHMLAQMQFLQRAYPGATW